MCSLLFVCISSKDAKCYPIRINDVWLNNLLNMYFTCNRHAIKLYLTQMFCFFSPHYYCQLCAPDNKKAYCHVLFVILCHVCIFSCQINNFQVQVQVNALASNFSWIILKCGNGIHCLRISGEFDYGGSASLNTRIMGRLASRSDLALLGSFSR